MHPWPACPRVRDMNGTLFPWQRVFSRSKIDMMISMIDSDGDGQVSYQEFHRLVIDPDPSRPEFGAEMIRDVSKATADTSQVSAP